MPIRQVLFGITGLLILLQLTNQIGLLFIGVTQWASFTALIGLLKNGFLIETSLAFVISLLLITAFWGISQRGFQRYLSFLLLGFLTIVIGLFLLGYVAFSFLYLENAPSISGLIGLFRAHYQDPYLWNHFIKTEGLIFILAIIAIALSLMERLKPSRKSLGHAHFSNGFETKKAGYFKKKDQSILIGKKYQAPLYANGFEHVLVFAPTGSGKTRSIGIPNLFQYPYSVVCNDVKLSLFQTTSGYRERVLGHQCYCWAPASLTRKTHCYNPLTSISKDKLRRITDIQRIAHILMPDNKKSDPIWQQASRKLFKTILLYLLDTPEKQITLGEINRVIKQANFDEWLLSLLENTKHLDAEFYRNGFSYINNHEKTRSSILETFSGYFELFDDPMIDAATASSDFDLSALRREKITIYIGFTDDDMERLSPLLTLFWQQLISQMIQAIPDPIQEPYPLLCLIDEFSSLGRIERLRRSLKLLREYRVRCVLIMQYIAQTYEQYSHDEAKAFTNIKTKIAFATEDMQDAEYISKLLGTKTVRIASSSVSQQTQGHSQSKSYQYQAVPLLRPDEIMKLSADVNLILRTGHAPLKAKQWIWYQQTDMKHLASLPSDVPEQTLKHYPFVHLVSQDLEPFET